MFRRCCWLLLHDSLSTASDGVWRQVKIRGHVQTLLLAAAACISACQRLVMDREDEISGDTHHSLHILRQAEHLSEA
jgi:hypothetical protein